MNTLNSLSNKSGAKHVKQSEPEQLYLHLGLERRSGQTIS